MTGIVIGAAAAGAAAGLFMLAGVVQALEQIAAELGRANALEQQRQNEDREHRGNVTQIRAGRPGPPTR